MSLPLPSPLPEQSDNQVIESDSSRPLSDSPSFIPEDLSQPAVQRLLANPDLLELIFHHLFVDAIGSHIAEPRYALGDRSLNPYNDFRMPHFTKLLSSGNLGIPPNTMLVMLACQDFFLLASKVFYRVVDFRTYAAESFRSLSSWRSDSVMQGTSRV